MRVSIEEFENDIEHYCDEAQKEPVIIMVDGKDSFVLLSIGDYEQLESHRKNSQECYQDSPDA